MGGDAVTIESIVLALFGTIIFAFTSDWSYYWIFLLFWVLAVLLMLLRIMAGQANNPDFSIIKRSLRWSTLLSELVLIGVIAALSIQISVYVPFLEPVALFAWIAIAIALSLAIIDQLVLREYASTWSSIIYDETGDTYIDQRLRDAGDFGEQSMEAAINNEPAESAFDTRKAILLALTLFAVFVAVTIPAWLILGRLFDGWLMGILAVFSIVFLRDATRYVYINYGAAQSLSELRWPLKVAFTLMLVKGILLAGALGYNLRALIT